MWLLILNSLKGLKTKKIQMLGLVFLIMFTTGVYTVMNSALDRMDSMSQSYMNEQNVEHMTLILDETNVLSRENIADMFNEKLNGWKDIELTPKTVTDETLKKFPPEQLEEIRAKIRSYGVPEPMIDGILKAQLGKVLAGTDYIKEIVDGTQPVNDLNAYLFYGCSASADNPETNNDPNLPYAKFCPINPEKKDRGEKDETKDECADTGDRNEYANTIMKLYSRFQEMTDGKKYDVDKYKYTTAAMDELAERYDFTYLLKANKTIMYDVSGDEQSYAASVMIYEDNIKVNTPYLVAGEWPKNDYEITVAPQFAETNDLQIGDYWKINDRYYRISGEAYAPDYIYPAISFNTPLYDEVRHTVMFANEKTYDEIDGVETKYYTARFNDFDGSYDSDELNELVKETQKNKNVAFVMSTATIHPRISTYTLEIKHNRVFASYFLYVLLAVAIFIIVMVMKKRIDDEQLQIGVLKSLGYKTWMIATGYLVYPLVGSLAGGVLGYLLGLALQTPVVGLYRSFYNIPINDFQPYYKYLILSVVIPALVLGVLSYAVALFMLRKRPLQLLREGSNLKLNAVGKAILKLISKLKFKTKFRIALASRSLGKLSAITLCAFCTGLLLVLTLIGSTMMNLLVEYTFSGASYGYQVQYATIQDPAAIEGYDEAHDGEDLILGTNLSLYRIEFADGREKVLDESYSISVEGAPESLNLIRINDEKGNDMTSELTVKKDGLDAIIVNDTIKTLFKVDTGDVLVFTKRVNIDGNVQCANDKRYYIAGVNQTFSGLRSYVSRASLAEYLGYGEDSYNYIYTNEEKDIYDPDNGVVRDVFRYDDLKRNLMLAVRMANYSIYIVVFFSGAMALVIISVVSNIVIDENKKHISLMKVMGYRDKEIKKVVLNIYTPFVIIAYFLSIPAMKAILRGIISLVVKDLSFSVPIVLSWQGALIGFVVIMVSYFLALQFSRRSLNRIPLAEALKRE